MMLRTSPDAPAGRRRRDAVSEESCPILFKDRRRVSSGDPQPKWSFV
jgi:hypothetical protein